MALAVVQWMIDTRGLWAVDGDLKGKDAMEKFQEVREAARELALLSASENQAVLRFYHVRDAKMSLASHLLKRLAITKLCAAAWPESTISRGQHGKPYFRLHNKALAFNVSHQAGLVALIACPAPDIDVGIDIVCVNERNDYRTIEEEGFFTWIDIHADVFAPSEIQAMKLSPDGIDLPGVPPLSGYGRDAISRCQWRNTQIQLATATGVDHFVDSNLIIDAKHRRFYAFWCLREAYVKMTGEALLASWLKRLEFRKFGIPAAAITEEPDNHSLLIWGEVKTEFDIFFKGKKMEDVTMELRALGGDYLISSCLRRKPGTTTSTLIDDLFPGFTEITLEELVQAAK